MALYAVLIKDIAFNKLTWFKVRAEMENSYMWKIASNSKDFKLTI